MVTDDLVENNREPPRALVPAVGRVRGDVHREGRPIGSGCRPIVVGILDEWRYEETGLARACGFYV